MSDPTGPDGSPDTFASFVRTRRVTLDGAATPPNTPLPGFTEDSCEEADTWGAVPDDPPPPMPWADVLAAAVVDVDADGTAQCAVQFVNEWLAGEDRAELHAIIGRQRLARAGLEADPVTMARLA